MGISQVLLLENGAMLEINRCTTAKTKLQLKLR